MPAIQFPKPGGPVNIFNERLLFAKAKAFNVIQAPNLVVPGEPVTKETLDGGLGNLARKPVNPKNPSKPERNLHYTSSTNPAIALKTVQVSNASATRVQGKLYPQITGVSRDATGAPLGNCVIKVYVTATDVVCATTTSDGSGNWSVVPKEHGPYYFVEYKAGTPVFGTSPNTNTNVPVAIV